MPKWGLAFLAVGLLGSVLAFTVLDGGFAVASGVLAGVCAIMVAIAVVRGRKVPDAWRQGEPRDA